MVDGIAAFFNPVLGPLLKLPVGWAVVIVSILATILVTLIYKWTTNQKEMKEFRDKMKKMQDDMNKNKHDTKKLLKIQKEMMDINMKYLAGSLKPTLYTLIPLLLLFAWLHATLAYDPIHPGEIFTTTLIVEDGVTGNVTLITPDGVRITSEPTIALPGNQVSFSVDGKSRKGNAVHWTMIADKTGEYVLEYEFNGKKSTKELLVTDKQEYYSPIKLINEGPIKEIDLSNKSLIVFSIGGMKVNWFWTYVLISIAFSMLLRKMLKIY